MAKSLIVMLGGDGVDKTKLVKYIDESYLKENFGDLLEYMLDPTSDELNQNTYNEDETDFANGWKQAYEKSKVESDYQVGLMAIDKNNQLVKCPLHKIVADYSDRIVKIKNQGGEDYKGIDLIIADTSSSGLS